MLLQKNYKASLNEELLATTSGEIEVKLSITPVNDNGFILLEPGISGKEETCFYHRKSGNSVFIYGVNRDNPTTHDIGVVVMLTNSIDSLNYILGFINESMYIYKKSIDNLVITGGKFLINGQKINIQTLDTSLNINNKKLIPGNTNYIYIKDNDYYISTLEQNLYLVSIVVVNGAGVIQSFTKERHNIIPGLNYTQDERDRLQALELSEIYSLEGIPDVNLGINGDIYLNKSNSDLYKKINGNWVYQFNIKGEQGLQGKKILIRINEGFIEYKYEGDNDYIQLVSFNELGGKINLSYQNISTSQSINSGYLYGVDCSNGNILLTLDNGLNIGDILSIKKIDNSNNIITINGNIEFDNQVIIDTQYESIDLLWNGNYFLIK